MAMGFRLPCRTTICRGLFRHLQSNLFQPFRRGDRKHDADRSIGLGLYIVHEVASAHGGRVEVGFTAMEGTTFTMRLPSACNRSPKPIPPDSGASH